MCGCLRDRVIMFHVMLCIIELALAHAQEAHAEKLFFFFLFSISVLQFHIECITDRMLCCDYFSEVPTFLGMYSMKCIQVVISKSVCILTLVS